MKPADLDLHFFQKLKITHKVGLLGQNMLWKASHQGPQEMFFYGKNEKNIEFFFVFVENSISLNI